MSSLANLRIKLKELDDIEKDVAQALHAAGQALTELGKDKPAMKPVESNTTNFLKTLQNVESSLSKHIIYLSQVSTVQPHEGSSYAAQKVFHMALHRLEHARSRMNELERVRQQHLQQDAQYNTPMPAQMPPHQQQMRGGPQQQPGGQPGSLGGPQQGMMMQPGIGQDMGQSMNPQGSQMGSQGPESPLVQGMGPGQQMNQMGAPMGGQQMMWQQSQMGMGQQMGIGSMGQASMGQSPMSDQYGSPMSGADQMGIRPPGPGGHIGQQGQMNIGGIGSGMGMGMGGMGNQMGPQGQ